MAPRISRQSLFDTVARHLLTQNRRSLSGDGRRSAYYAPDGARSPIGCLIQDRYYRPEIEDHYLGFGHPGKPNHLNDALKKSGAVTDIRNPATDELSFISDLEMVHNGYRPTRWRDGLRSVAAAWHLSDHVLLEFE